MEFKFKVAHTLEERTEKSKKILSKYPDRIPIICERDPKSTLDEMDKSKILVPSDLTIAQFITVIRKRVKLEPEMALFLFVGGSLVPTAKVISDVYAEYKDEDGFLYVSYSAENSFGFGHL